MCRPLRTFLFAAASAAAASYNRHVQIRQRLEPTHSSSMIVQILHEGIATGLAAQRAGLMKEVVEAHEFAKLGEDLDESIFIHCWMKVADVETVLEEFTLKWRLRKGGRCRWIGLRGRVGEM